MENLFVEISGRLILWKIKKFVLKGRTGRFFFISEISSHILIHISPFYS